MDTSAFIKALTETLFISVGQAIIIVLFFKIMFKAVPDIPSSIKFKLWYAALVLVFVLFVSTLSSLYVHKNGETLLPINHISVPEGPKVTLLSRLMVLEDRYAGIIAFIYFAGVFIQMSFLFIAWLHIRGFRKNKTLLDRDWDMRFAALRMKAGVKKDVSLHLSNRIAVPLTTGFLKPLILVPVAMLNNLTTQQVEAILLHELAHIRRDDYLLNLFQRIMETVLFFNPVISTLSKEIEKEREYCCDEMVVNSTGDPIIYGNALLMLEEQKYQNQLALAANGNGNYPLLMRIKRFTVMKKLNSSPKARLVVLATIISIGLSLAWSIPSARRENIDATDLCKTEEKDNIKVIHVLQGETDTAQREQRTPVRKVKKRIIHISDSSKVVHNNPQWKGLQKELKETSAEIQKLVEQQTKFLHSDEWKQHQNDLLKNSEDIKKHFNSAEWKKIQKEITINSQELTKHFNSPEWKKREKELQKNASNLANNLHSPQLKKRQEKVEKEIKLLNKKFETDEWKNKQKEIERNADNFNKILKSSEWKERQQDLERKSKELSWKFQESPEFKNKLKDLEKKIEDLSIKMEALQKKEEQNK